MGNVGTWERQADALVLHIGEDQAVFGRVREGSDAAWRQSVGFHQYEQNPDLSLDGFELALQPSGQPRARSQGAVDE
jgi:hypothetical protein